MEPIPYGKQFIDDNDIHAVVETLKSSFLTQGPKVKEFEEAFAKYVGCEFAVAVSNGTAALHLSAMALGVKTGTKVITAPITFAATGNCIRYCGGDVVFCDIDPATYLLDINKVRSLLEASPKGTYSGIIPIDFAGRPVNLEVFRKLADEYGCWIIEDACHAPGGYFIDSKGSRQICGNGKFAELSIFSFHPVKHIATGEGGMITTNDPGLYKELLKLRTHGITRETSQFSNDVSFAVGESNGATEYPGWYMEMQELGYNYRLTDFQSALGISQLKKADAGLDRRRQLAKIYEAAFKGHPKVKGQSGVVEGHAYHLYVIEADRRLDLYNYLRENKVYAQIHYVPLHLMPYYRQLGWKVGDMPDSENYYKRCISLPMFPTLTDEEINFVIGKVIQFFS